MLHLPCCRDSCLELAEQCVAVLRGPVGQMRDKVLDLLAGGLAKGLHATEVSGVGLDQGRIELMLADDLAEAVADLGAAVVSVGGLWGELLRLPRALW